MYWIFTDRRLLRRAADRDLHLPAGLPGPARRALQGGAGADRHGPRRPRRARQPGDRRGGGHRRRLPRRRAPHRRAVGADADGDGRCSPSWRCSPAWSRSPASTTTITRFLDPVFADSPLAAIHPSVARRLGRAWRSARRSRSPGIGIAYWLYVARPETPAMLSARLRPLHTFLVNKWYFDEAIDILVVRPALAVGRFANRTFERVVVDGLVTRHRGRRSRGAGGVVRARAERLRPQLRAAPDRRLRRPRPLLPAERS